jgi:hypothetical protein
MAYNPVTNPNPEGTRPKTSVLSQFDGNIVNDENADLIRNMRSQTGLPIGEDMMCSSTDDMDDDD